MANFLADPYRNSLIGKTADYAARVDFDTDVIKCSFIDEGSDTVAVTDVFVSNITAAALVPVFASSVTLTGASVGVSAVGATDATDTLFSALSGASVEGILVYKFVTLNTDSPVLASWNTGITGMPFTPSGGDVTIQWNASGLWQV